MTMTSTDMPEVFSRSYFDAVIFDLDGVITETAGVHAAAWKQMFDAYLKARAAREGTDFEPFRSDEDYQRYVDGKPRYDGVNAFLQSRGIELPRGAPEDPPDRETVCGLGNRKNELFRKHLDKKGVKVYQSSVALVRRLRSKGFRVAIISSSKNCRAVLDSARITELFEQIVDGVVSEQLGLNGKPASDIFLEASRRLGASPERSVVVEDALSGVEAGKKGGFGRVIGVDRSGQAERLKEYGADLVVSDLSELHVAENEPKAMTRDLPSALAEADRIEKTLEGRKPAIFLDYDGTLTPIVRRPEDAVLSEAMQQAVKQLASACTVAVISGRDMKDVRRRVGLEEVVYAGSHGFEIAGPDGLGMENEAAAEFLPVMDRAETALKQAVSGIEGARVERKKFAIALHFREVDTSRIPEVEQAVDRVSKQLDRLRVSRGKMIFEFQPGIEWDKGHALLWLLDALELDPEHAMPFYIGDDTTDEDAFQALRDRGIGIVVETESRPTAARYILAGTDEVKRFLEHIMGWVSN